MAELKAKIGLETNAFETGLARLQNKVGSFAKGIGGLVVGAFAFDKLLSFINNAVDKADRLQDLADKFGVSASQLQLLGNVAELSGSSLEDVASALNKAAINASKAATDDKLAQNFRRIGLSVEQLRTASPQDILMAFARAAETGSLGADEFRVAQELLGRSSTNLLATLRQGPAAIEAQGRAMGVWADSTIKTLSNYKDVVTALSNAVTIAFGKMAQAAAPALSAVARFFGQNDIAAMLDEVAKPPVARQQEEGGTGKPFSSETQEKILDNVRKRLEIEAKIAEKGMTQEQIAQRLLLKYEELATAQKTVEMENKTESGRLKSSELLVEMAQIKERLAGMTDRTGSFQVLADSLQQVGGGGRFAQVGGQQTNDYLRAIKDSSAITAKALQGMTNGNNIGSVTPVGAQ